MSDNKTVWNSQFKIFQSILMKPDKFTESVALLIGLHAMLHVSEISGRGHATLEDEIWDGLEEQAFRSIPGNQAHSVAWCLWHNTRIEDITVNILISNSPQVISQDNWMTKINAGASDTGNSMSPEEIARLSSRLNMREFKNYRMAVGRRTQEVIKSLTFSDLKRKMLPASLQRIYDEGAVLETEGASWLVDFWGRKNVAGLLLMPVTRHQPTHLNECLKLLKKKRIG